ncbi:MAG: flagellar protein FlgN [Oscillospiraceae bacterium]|nr:flagellar protein FlgN [Oscillospiraceae bacterium]
MRPVLIELCKLLSQQKAVLERILELSLEERRIIISGEAESLEEIVRSGLQELNKLGAIEKKRLALHGELATQFRLPIEEVNVSAIAKLATPQEGAAIRELQSELTMLISAHMEVNAENRELIDTHIEYSEIMINLMVDSEDPLNNFYDGDGNASPDRKKTTGFFDSRA